MKRLWLADRLASGLSYGLAHRSWWWRGRGGWTIALGLLAGLLVFAGGWGGGLARGGDPPILPRTYPLPSRLETVLEPTAGDYFGAIAPASAGYLLWSDWPVQVYVQPEDAPPGQALYQRQSQWRQAVVGAIADWSLYLPLEITAQRQTAQILILRQQPPLRWQAGQLGPARQAETRYRIWTDRDGQGQPCLRHQQTLSVGDRQGTQQLRGTLRHELGHALGLWGHSPDPGDVLYAQQVADPPPISARDINTLWRLYRQPTRLGCLVGHPETDHGS